MTQNDFLVLARVVVLDAAISPRFILQDKIGQVWLFLPLIVVLECQLCCAAVDASANIFVRRDPMAESTWQRTDYQKWIPLSP